MCYFSMKKAKQEHKEKVEKYSEKESLEQESKKVKDYDYDYIDKLGKLIGRRNFP